MLEFYKFPGISESWTEIALLGDLIKFGDGVGGKQNEEGGGVEYSRQDSSEGLTENADSVEQAGVYTGKYQVYSY